MFAESTDIETENLKLECVHRLFEQQAGRTPDAVALSFEDRRITYRELNSMANVVARRLQELGVGPEVIVAICLERSVAMIAGLLGILKAGGAYLPLDTSSPAERIAFIMSDAQSGVLLTQRGLAAQLPTISAQIVCLDEINFDQSAGAENLSPQVTPQNLAYVIYTSGSTGQPKGCLVTHENVVRLFSATQHWFGFSATDVWTMFHSHAFDFSVWEIFGALLHGGRLVVVPFDVSRSPELFHKLLDSERVTVLNQTPSAFRALIRAGDNIEFSSGCPLRYVIFGGEALDFQSLRPWFDRHGDQTPQLVNMYGITETTVHVTYRPIALQDLESDSGSLIGVPIPDLQLHVLDEKQQPAPIGVPGEMYVGGAGVARGYLNRAELTAERFIENPFNGANGGRLYKTGDLARLLPSGDLRYLGRIDHQVKIRGFRIELGEIESAINLHPEVRESAVIARDRSGDNELIAYVVGKTDVATDELRAWLRVKLPDYMIPATFVRMDALPLTTNGKLDRRALPLPGDEGFRPMRRMEAAENSLTATTNLEAELIRIWEETLQIRPIGIRENFFDLGGHSLLAVAVSREVAKRLGKRVSVATLFRAPTVQELAIALSAGKSGDENSLLEKIRVTGTRTPFFCMPGLFDLAHCLGPDQPCYGLNLPEFGETPDKWPDIEVIAAGSIQAMRAVQPKGPYCVGGYSIGGVVAYEIARQLEAAGEKVSLLAMIDPDPPRPYRNSGLHFYFCRILFHGRRLAGMSMRKKADYVLDRLRKRSKTQPPLWNIGDQDEELATYLLRMDTIHARYHALPFGGEARVFLAGDTLWRVLPSKDPRLDWGKFVGGKMETYETPGDHTAVIHEPNVKVLAKYLGEFLQQVS